MGRLVALWAAAALLSVAAGSATQWVNPTAWPDVGNNYAPDGVYPTWFDRGATFWFSLLRETYGDTTIFSPTCFAGLSGFFFNRGSVTQASYPSAPMGLNTLRVARFHASDRFNNCLNVAAGMVAADATGQLADCDGTATTTRYTSYLAAATAQATVYEYSFARPFTPPWYYMLHAPVMAVTDLASQSGWKSGNELWYTLFNSPLTLANAGELSCSGMASNDGTHLNAYSISCVQTAECESCTASNPSAQSWSNHLIATAGHTYAYYTTAMWFAVTLGNTVTGVQVVANGGTPTSLSRVNSGNHWYSYSGFSKKRACTMYHFLVTDGTNTYRYPTVGEFGTIHLNGCSVDYVSCACASGDGACCSDNCNFDTSGTSCGTNDECVTSECTGSSATCQVTNTGDGTACGNKTAGTCRVSDTCQSGACVSGDFADGTLCGLNETCRNDTCIDGTCTRIVRPNGAVCASVADGVCTLDSQCSAGVCTPVYQPASHTCATASPGDPCDADDKCSGINGTCETRHAPVNTSCGTATSCILSFLCDGSGVCLEDRLPNGTVCAAATPGLLCDAADECQDGVCVDYVLPSVTLCRNSSDAAGCDPPEYCAGVNGTCPPDVPIDMSCHCALYTDPHQCDLDAGCQWCGDWGCLPYSNVSGSDYCRVHACNATTTDLLQESFVETTVCPVTLANATSLEMVSPVRKTELTIARELCFVLDVESLALATTSAIDSGIINVTVVVYNATAAGDAPHTLLLSRPAHVDVDVAGLNLVSVNLTQTIADFFVIAPNTLYFVGISFANTCPHIDIVNLDESGGQGPSRKRSAGVSTFVRDPTVPGSSWTTTNVSFGVTAALWTGICGDSIVAGTEQCDLSDWCLGDCTCGAFAASSGGLCVCNETLPVLDGHTFVGPPTLEVDFTSADDVVLLTVVLPETNPGRGHPVASIVNPRNGLNVSYFTPLALSLINPCEWGVTANTTIAELMTYGVPRVVAYPAHYALSFAIEVAWVENVTMHRSTGVPVARYMSSTLTFEVLVARQLSVTANVTMVDSTLLWAYIKRGYLVIPDAPALPYFEVAMDTMPKADGIYVVNDSFHYGSHTGQRISTISDPTLVGYSLEVDGYVLQSWLFNVYLNNSAVCSMGSGDNFTLSYALASLLGEQAAGTQLMALSLATSETWCSVSNATVTLAADMTVYAADTPMTTAARRFLRGSTAYFRIEVPTPQYGMTIQEVFLTSVSVSGGALIVAPGPVGAEWALSNISCPGLHNNEACFSLLLPMADLQESAQLSVTATVYVDVSTRRRSFALDSRASVASAHVFITHPRPGAAQATAAQGEAAARPSTVVVYRVTPMFMALVGTLTCVAILSVMAAVYVMNRPDSIPL
eukprot:m51a1_g7271 putative C-tail anchored protein (1369) ;mRNA; r:214863-219516